MLEVCCGVYVTHLPGVAGASILIVVKVPDMVGALMSGTVTPSVGTSESTITSSPPMMTVESLDKTVVLFVTCVLCVSGCLDKGTKKTTKKDERRSKVSNNDLPHVRRRKQLISAYINRDSCRANCKRSCDLHRPSNVHRNTLRRIGGRKRPLVTAREIK